MNVTCTWNEKLKFTTTARQHVFPMDAKTPVGSDEAATPKELLLAAIGGCTAMDVVSLFRKARVDPESFRVDVHADVNAGHPATFKSVKIDYHVTGALPPETVLDAVKKSMTLYCGVNAMIAKACPVTYDVHLNGAVVGSGEADFS